MLLDANDRAFIYSFMILICMCCYLHYFYHYFSSLIMQAKADVVFKDSSAASSLNFQVHL